MQNTKWIVVLISAMMVTAALAGVVLGIREEFEGTESDEQ